MSWSAYHIYALSTPPVISKLNTIPELSNHIYQVPALSAFKPSDVDKENLKDKQIIIIPLGNPGGTSFERSNNSIAWNSLSGYRKIELGFADSIIQELNPKERNLNVAEEFRSMLKVISIDTNSTISFYCHVTWAGMTEYEFAWIFEPDETVYVWLDNKSFAEARKDGSRQICQGGLLVDENGILVTMLNHFGFLPKSNYFKPHERDFPWDSFRLGKIIT